MTMPPITITITLPDTLFPPGPARRHFEDTATRAAESPEALVRVVFAYQHQPADFMSRVQVRAPQGFERLATRLAERAHAAVTDAALEWANQQAS